MTTTEILTGIKNWVLSKLNLKQDVINDLAAIRSGSQAGSTAVQPSDLSSYFNNASYDTSTHRINFYHGQNIVAYVDASPFIVDGMVDDVRIENGYLVIDFNIASGKQDISIPLTEIFDPSNYYNKTQTNTLLGNKVDKVSGKGLSTNDYTNAEKEKLSGLQNYDDTQVRQLIGQKQDIIQDLEDIRSGASAGASAVQPSTLNSALSDTVAESGVYDVTANNNNAKFASLSALLGSENLDTLIPSAKRKGGMSIKFVQSTDNKYVQARCMAQNFTTDVTQWQGVVSEPIRNSKDLIDSGGVYETTFITSEISQRTRNLFNPLWFSPSIVKDGEWYSGTGRSWAASVSTFTGEANTQYTLSVLVKAGNAGAIKFIFNYSDGTSDTLATTVNLSVDTLMTKTSASGKTVSSITFSYGSSGLAVSKAKDIQLEKGTSATSYVPYITANDYILKKRVENDEKTTDVISQETKNLFRNEWMPIQIECVEGVYHATKQKMASLINFPFNGETNTQYVISSKAKVNAFFFQFKYSDNTTSNAGVGGSVTEFHYNYGVSTAGKTVIGIAATYSGSGSEDCYIKDIQIEKSSYPTPYIPHMSAKDFVLDQKTSGIGECVNGIYKYQLMYSNAQIRNDGWTFSGYNGRDVMLSEPIHLNAGDTITLSDDTLKIKWGWQYQDGTYSYINWITGGDDMKQMVKATGLYVFIIERVNATQATFAEIYNALTISKNLATLYSDELPNKCFVSIAHRGVSRLAPENTLPAFVMAKKLHFDGFETDVTKTVDGNYVMCHDETVNRTSNGSGKISEMTLAELKALDFGSWFSPDFVGTRIPTFEEMIICCKIHGITPYIELKSWQDSMITNSDMDNLIAIIKKHGMFKNIVFLTYFGSALAYISETYPGVRIGLFGSASAEQIANYQAINGTEGIFPYITEISETDVANCKAADIPLGYSVFTNVTQIRNAYDYATAGLSDCGNPAAIKIAIANES